MFRRFFCCTPKSVAPAETELQPSKKSEVVEKATAADISAAEVKSEPKKIEFRDASGVPSTDQLPSVTSSPTSPISPIAVTASTGEEEEKVEMEVNLLLN